MSELDEIDSSNMREMVNAFPVMLRNAKPEDSLLEAARDIGNANPAGICMIGMGGSAISNEILRSHLSDTIEIPLYSLKHYTLPKFVNRDWVVIAVSYSGNTEETLAAFQESIDRGCTTFGVTTGGQLKKLCNKKTLHQLHDGFQPRAALPLILGGLLLLLESFLDMQVTNLTAIANELHERALIWPSAPINPSSIAKRIENHVPLFVGWKHLAPVAYRAKCQINENAKSISMSSELPEANHNEIESIESFSKFSIRPIILRSSHEDERTRKRFKITSDLLKEAGCEVINISLESGDTLMESLAFTYFLDLMSIELAELHQVDPVSVLRISELKRRLNS